MYSNETRILVADDMKTMRLVVKTSLNSLGSRNVTEFVDGGQAWSAFESAQNDKPPYSLIISDWTMPKLSGLDFLKKVRSHPTLSATPFLLLTGETDIALVKEAIAAGVSNYITKPFSAEILRDKLKAVYLKHEKKSA